MPRFAHAMREMRVLFQLGSTRAITPEVKRNRLLDGAMLSEGAAIHDDSGSEAISRGRGHRFSGRNLEQPYVADAAASGGADSCHGRRAIPEAIAVGALSLMMCRGVWHIEPRR